MSLIKQVWLLLLATILGAFLASFAVSIVSARGYLETQLRIKNNDNAQSLALTLSQLKGDAVSMELAVAAQFDTGYYALIRFDDASGKPVIERAAADVAMQAPDWFIRLVPLQSPAGVAQVSDGWRALGSVTVVSHAGFAYGDLWRGSLRTGGLLAVLGVLAALVAAWAVGRIRRPLDATVDQALALVQRRFVVVDEGSVPELQRVSRAMNTMVGRVQAMFDEQAADVERLRREATCDPLTGLAHRRHFLAQLQGLLEADRSADAGVMVLVRVADLAGLNQGLGRQRVDAMLVELARALVVDAGPAPVAGRLNGSDFAVCLSAGQGMDAAVAALEERILALRTGFGVEVCGAAAMLQGHQTVSALMTDADATLARAESTGSVRFERADAVPGPAAGVAAGWGEEAWRAHLQEALAQGRTALMAYRVIDAHGALMHMECPMRIAPEPGGAMQAAAVWLPFALRTGVIQDADLAAVQLALRAIEADQVPRGVNLALASLKDSRFMPALRHLLEAAPRAAGRLWLEVPEAVAVGHMDRLADLCEQAHDLGAKVGLEHVGARLTGVDGLLALGLDYVKLDGAVTRGLAADSAQASYVAGMVRMLRGVGLVVIAEGVSSAEDARSLWGLGVDGMTGPWVG